MTSVLEQALIFITAAVVFVPIFQRLGFGAVLGYLIAGVLVGPHAFQLIGDAESVMHFSELGVVFLLFVIGLEIQPAKLWSMRKHLLGLGGLQMVVCTGAFALIGLWWGLAPLAAFLVAFSLSLSSTAFAVQTLVERNQFNTEFGRGSFSILLMQDLAAIPALAVIPFLAREATVNPAEVSWWGMVLVLAVILGARFVMRPLFRIIAGTRSRDVFTATALFIVIGVAALMQKVGLSAALGSFIAGVLLADSEYRHELEANIDPFKGLLMGLFFIAVGMGVRLDLLANHPAMIAALVVGYVTLKSLLIYGVGRIFRYNHRNAKQMALNIAQGGEFAFVIFGIMGPMNMIDREMLEILTAVITVSMALSPLILMGDNWLSTLVQKAQVPNYDEIKGEHPEVIIAGFGRFGQIFGRILRAQEIPFVGIDHDSTQIEQLRKFGSVVYYGDASRIDLLETAGARQAKFFVLAIDDVEASLKTAQLVKEKFPHLTIFARARNRGHAFDLMDLGIRAIKRETIDSSVNFVGQLLVEMGFEVTQAERITQRFREHDEIALNEQFKVRTDDKSLISVSRQAAAQLAQVLKDDTLHSRIVTPRDQ